MATHSSILAWRIPWTEEPGRLQPIGRKELDTTEQLSLKLSPTWWYLGRSKYLIQPASTRARGVPVCSSVRLFVTPWTVACQAPLSMESSRQEYWSGLPFPPPGDLPDLGIELTSLVSPALAGRFFTIEPPT